MAYTLGGKVESAKVSEYGKTEIDIDKTGMLFHDVSEKTIGWMSHTDYIAEPPEGFRITASTPVCPVAGMEDNEHAHYAVQYHHEVTHSVEGNKVLHAFVYDVCGCSGDWKMDDFVERTIEDKQLTCVFVDHGLLRKNEADEVDKVFGPGRAIRPELCSCRRT